MKKIYALLLTCTLLLTLTCCGNKTAETGSAAVSAPAAASSSAPVDSEAAAKQAAVLKELSSVLAVDCSEGTVTKSSDTHDDSGLGTTFHTVSFSDGKFAKAIGDNESWHALPLSESLTTLVYGTKVKIDSDDLDLDDLDEDSSEAADEDSDAEYSEEDAEEENSDIVFEEDEDMPIDPPVFEETPDENDLEEGVDPVVINEAEGDQVELYETIGPFLTGKKGKPLIPEVKNGSYFFLDRSEESTNPQSDKDILNHDSMHVTLAVYDKDQKTLYYTVFDDELE